MVNSYFLGDFIFKTALDLTGTLQSFSIFFNSSNTEVGMYINTSPFKSATNLRKLEKA